MHAFARHHHDPSDATTLKTKGLVLNQSWRYDLTLWYSDMFLFRGQLRQMWRRAVTLAGLQPGAQVLDVGCGTGTLALEVQRTVGTTGHVCGIDPGTQQIARARAKATQRHLPTDFQVGVIEQIPFPDQTFDVVFSTLMMHHLGQNLKRQGLAEIARVLKPGGRLIIADFKRKQERQGRAAHFHAGGSSMTDLAILVQAAGLTQVTTEDLPALRFSAFPGAGFICACKS